MKKLIQAAILAVALIGISAYAQTNIAPSVTETNLTKGWPMELTLGGSGITMPKTGQTTFGLDFSYSVQPL